MCSRKASQLNEPKGRRCEGPHCTQHQVASAAQHHVAPRRCDPHCTQHHVAPVGDVIGPDCTQHQVAPVGDVVDLVLRSCTVKKTYHHCKGPH